LWVSKTLLCAYIKLTRENNNYDSLTRREEIREENLYRERFFMERVFVERVFIEIEATWRDSRYGENLSVKNFFLKRKSL
jgi:hypothetical protein